MSEIANPSPEVAVRKMKMRNLRKEAMFDHVTGTPNRRYLDREMQEQLARARRHKHQLAVAMVDLDNFGPIDRRDHLKGDEVLRTFAQRLNSLIRQDDFFGRFGGDEWTILMPQTDEEGAKDLIFRLQKELQELFQQEGFGATWGLTITDGNLSPKDTFRQADRALTELKENNQRGNLGVFKRGGEIETVNLSPAESA